MGWLKNEVSFLTPDNDRRMAWPKKKISFVFAEKTWQLWKTGSTNKTRLHSFLQNTPDNDGRMVLPKKMVSRLEKEVTLFLSENTWEWWKNGMVKKSFLSFCRMHLTMVKDLINQKKGCLLSCRTLLTIMEEWYSQKKGSFPFLKNTSNNNGKVIWPKKNFSFLFVECTW